MTQTVTTTRTPHQVYNGNRGTPQEQRYALRNNAVSQLQEDAPRNNITPQRQAYAPRDNITPQRQEYAPQDNTTPQYQEFAPRNSATSRNREHAPGTNAADIRPFNEGDAQIDVMSQTYRGDLSSNRRSNAYDSPNVQDEHDAGLARQKYDHRKQIGTSANTPYSSVQASSRPMAQMGHSRQQSATKPLPSTPAAANQGNTDRQTDSASTPSSMLNRSRPIATSQAGLRDAQDVVDRAKTNTHDTQVIETVAPGEYHSRIVNH